MIHLILYDISSDQLRTKIAKHLIAEGFTRIQYSVYAGAIDPRYNRYLLQDLNTWITIEKTAKIFLLILTEDQFKNIMILGKNNLDMDFIIGLKNSIFI